MKRKKGRPGFTQSESELLLSALDRHDDWAVVVCLVGGGQEINTGEAGIGAWLESVRTAFPGWDVFISPHLTDSVIRRAKTGHSSAPKTGHRVGGIGRKNPLVRTCWQGV